MGTSSRRARPPGGPTASRADARRHQGKTEEMFHGVRACEAVFARRPGDIVRVYVTDATRKRFARLLEWCARERKGFQVVADENLERLTKSIHHEGVAILATTVKRWSLDDLLAHVAVAKATGPLVYLDGVQNPHNLGSILRTAAHFGVAAIVGRAGELPPLSPAAVRVAEGAAEFVPVCDLADPAADLRRIVKAGFRIVATSSHRGKPLAEAKLGGRVMLVLGSEGEGVSRPIEAAAAECVQIPGTGTVESLNVGVACGVVLGEAWRQREGQPSGR
ncbi:MAG: TrmH family RNA methyltransferase [Pirellulales bacterium]